MRLRFTHLILSVALVAAFAGDAWAQGRKSLGGRRPARKGRSVIEQFNRMPPDQRRKVMDRLPPERKKVLEERLESYNSLSTEERQKLRERYDVFRELPPERQEKVRQLFRRFNDLPEDRRGPLREEIQTLRGMPEADRNARIRSEEFRQSFSTPEQRLLEEMSEALPLPPKPAPEKAPEP